MPQTDFSQFASLGSCTIGRQENVIISFSKSENIHTEISVVYDYHGAELDIPVYRIYYADLIGKVNDAGITMTHHGMFNFNLRKKDDFTCLYYGDYELFYFKHYEKENQIHFYFTDESGNEVNAGFIGSDLDGKKGVSFASHQRDTHFAPSMSYFK